MVRYFLAAWALPIVVAAPLAWAQAAPGNSRPDPQDAKASVPSVTYRSPLADYRALSDEKVMSWKETNDNVARIGGWRVYAKEAQEPGSVGETTQGTANRPAPANEAKPHQSGHGGHKMD